MSPKSGLRKAGIGLAAFALVAGAFAGLSSAANAAGTSAKTANCYAQWWNTAFAGKCSGATRDIWPVYVYGDCALELDWEDGPFSIKKGFSGTFDSNECTFSVNKASLLFS
ncbi:hypothetical protein Pth03_72380 [Planotetraspora thailandica]|uniref:Streptomyces killer toxin-like beta/gamma crystallin domain-containing protein n=1 Tax=Planotetraspora thailandica TaxID=487172 RepID=A0A8J3Y151_9ACTN|nr:hypothetical protein [Planotetraspora thailandica]GII58849.1 hypothetical protein Pth03_72380 [Planotetraspora thailandica]